MRSIQDELDELSRFQSAPGLEAGRCAAGGGRHTGGDEVSIRARP